MFTPSVTACSSISRAAFFFVLCAAAAMTLPALRQSIPWTPYAPNRQAAQYRMPPKDAVGIP
jgi:hypothetical protein